MPYPFGMDTKTPVEPSATSLNRFADLPTFLGSSFLVAAIGGIATGSSVKTWYRQLNRPTWTPPDWLFGPVWTILYFMMAIAAWLVWKSPEGQKDRALFWYWLQLLLNGAWSWLFFYLQSPWLGFIEIIALVLAVLKTIREFAYVRPAAALLLIPYLLWIIFASALNFAIALLNR